MGSHRHSASGMMRAFAYAAKLLVALLIDSLVDEADSSPHTH